MTELLQISCRIIFISLLIELALLLMDESQKNYSSMYSDLGMTVIFILNLYFFLKVLDLLFPYLDFNFRNNLLYEILRNKLPCLMKKT